MKKDPRDHSHYGPDVQNALAAFRDVWTSYYNLTWLDFRENAHRLDSVQVAWNRLARARKSETGCGLYLDPEQYKKAFRRKHGYYPRQSNQSPGTDGWTD